MQPQYRYRGVLVSVYDADTVRLDIDLGLGVWCKRQSIRLWGIDAPEVRGVERELGLAARDYLLGLVAVGDKVIVDTMKDTTGKYGRWIGKIWYHTNGVWRHLNDDLVSAGHAVYVGY